MDLQWYGTACLPYTQYCRGYRKVWVGCELQCLKITQLMKKINENLFNLQYTYILDLRFLKFLGLAWNFQSVSGKNV